MTKLFSLLQDFDLLKSYITRIQELESELVRIRSSNHLRRGNSDDFLYSEDEGTHSKNLFMDADIKTEETDGMLPPTVLKFNVCGSLNFAASSLLVLSYQVNE